MQLLNKPTLVQFLDEAVVHEVLNFDVGRLRIALADEIDHRLEPLLA